MNNSRRVIYIIEDDRSINNGIMIALGEEFEYKQYYSLGELDDTYTADLIILDINLPDGSGLDFLKEFRKKSDVPVLILTANDTELDEVAGLSFGADDYVKKPFSLTALRLRVKNLLTRSVKESGSINSDIYSKNGLMFDFNNLKFKKNNAEIELSKTEIRLLKIFTENDGIILSRDRLIEYVWQNQQYVDENALTVSVKRLRDKLEDNGETLIHTVYGIGYVFRQEADV